MPSVEQCMEQLPSVAKPTVGAESKDGGLRCANPPYKVIARPSQAHKVQSTTSQSHSPQRAVVVVGYVF